MKLSSGDVKQTWWIWCGWMVTAKSSFSFTSHHGHPLQIANNSTDSWR